jgi:hypothetical protein
VGVQISGEGAQTHCGTGEGRRHRRRGRGRRRTAQQPGAPPQHAGVQTEGARTVVLTQGMGMGMQGRDVER